MRKYFRVTMSLVIGLTFAMSLTSCKSRGTGSAVRGGVDPRAADETVLPEYKARFLDTDAENPPVTTDFTAVPLALDAGLENQAAGFSGASQGDPATYRHFFSIYAWQGVGPFNLPRYTHVFAVFARVEGPNLEADPIRYFTISWDAADGIIGMALPAKRGKNYTLQQSYELRDALGASTDVRRSRMVEIHKSLFDAAFVQFTRVSQGALTGAVSYKMMDDLDGRQRIRQSIPDGYSNCQHAISDILAREDGSLLETGLARGFAAGDLIYEWFANNIINRDPGLEIVAQRIRLQKPAN